MRILWAMLCQDVVTSPDDHIIGIYNPLSAFIFDGKPDVSQTPYEIPGTQIHAVLMCYNDSEWSGTFSISVAFMPPTGSRMASGGERFHNLEIEPGGREIFHLTLPLYYEVDGDYTVVFSAYKEGGDFGEFETLLHISGLE